VRDLLLEKGLVLDVFARVSAIGIELAAVDARIVIASVDTYLHFAEAVDRLDLGSTQDATGLPDVVHEVPRRVAASKTRGVLEGSTR
jgi:hypothetical protein